MPFDLTKKDVVERFYYPNFAEAMELPEDEREWVEFRAPNAEFLKQLDNQTKERRIEYVQPRNEKGKIEKAAPIQRLPFLDWKKGGEELWKELYWDFAIPAWQIFETSGKAIPCTVENKLIMLDIPEFDLWAGSCLRIMAENRQKLFEDQEKNLSSSANGPQNDQPSKTM